MGTTVLGFLVMIVLVTTLFFFAVSFQLGLKIQFLMSSLYQKVKHFFSGSSAESTPLSIQQAAAVAGGADSGSLFQYFLQPRVVVMETPDLEAGLQKEEENLRKERELLDKERQILEKDWEVGEKEKRLREREKEMESPIPLPAIPPPSMPIKPKRRNLDTAIEKPSPPSVTTLPPSTYEEWQEPMPIDESDVPKDINGWCFVGQSKGARGCAPVGKMDKCVTGEIYANQMECLQIHPGDVPLPITVENEITPQMPNALPPITPSSQ